MTQSWKAFLIENGIEFNGSHHASLNNAEKEGQTPSSSSMLSSLSDLGLIKITGDDAESFLQNQLTNDIRNITETTHQASAWCTPKGRMIADFRIFKHQDNYHLAVSADLLAHVIKKLQMYVMMSKVTIEDVSNSFVHFSFSGQSAAKELQTILANDGSSAPTKADQNTCYKSLNILRFPGSIPRFEIFANVDLNHDDAKELWLLCKESGKAHAVIANSIDASNNAWHYLNISSGLPYITQPSSESWIPQMVNYIAIGGVDFKKGCYPGQEVVARLNYLGKTKRRMYRLLIDTETMPAINDSIASDTDNSAGKILNVAINTDGKVEALAVLKIAEANKNALTLVKGEDEDETNKNTSITLLDLPYSLEEA